MSYDENLIGRFIKGFRYRPDGRLPLHSVYEKFVDEEGQINDYLEHNDMYIITFKNTKGGKMFEGEYPAKLIELYLID